MNKYITQNEDRFQNFFSKYDHQNNIICNQSSKTYLQIGEDYICQFCGRKKPTVTFKKDAHIIPQLLGNRFLLSKSECDECNLKFSKYEDAIASFLGFFRTFAQIKGQKGKGIPKFKDPRTGFEVYLIDDKIEMVTKNPESETIINEDKKSLKLIVNKQSYIPLYVFKCLLKIGLSSISNDEIEDYKVALSFLSDDKMDSTLSGFPLARLFVYFVPGPFYSLPAAFLYRRKIGIEKPSFPMHTLLVFFRNHMYQIFLPFNEKDKHLYQGKVTLNLPIAPLIYDKNLLPEGTNYTWDSVDLSSCDKKIKEPYEVNMRYDSIDKK